MIISPQVINNYLQPYILEKYDYLTEVLLSDNIEQKAFPGYFGINFKTRLDELIFITLYERSLLDEYRKFLANQILEMIDQMPITEFNLLLLKETNDLTNKRMVEREYFIVKEIISIVNNKLIEHLSRLAESKYIFYANKIIEGLKNFSFNGSICGDYPSENYWEDFCIISQEGFDDIYDDCWEDVYSYIYQILSSAPVSDLMILYSGTEDIEIGEYTEPFGTKAMTMIIESITSKLYYLISFEASYKDINYLLFPGEFLSI